MGLSDLEREKLREEELARCQVREGMKLKQRLRLIALTAIWVVALTILAFVGQRFAH